MPSSLVPFELLSLDCLFYSLLLKAGVYAFFNNVKFSIGLIESMNSLILSLASASKSILLMIASKRLSLGMMLHLIKKRFMLT